MTNSEELPVAANVKYLYFLTDQLLNVNLKSTLTSNFFKRGIQNIQIGGEPLQRRDHNAVKYSLTDCTKNVKELSTAMRDKCATVFLTITLNMKKHPGINVFIENIDDCFPDKSSEHYKAAVQCYLPVILRMWNKTRHPC